MCETKFKKFKKTWEEIITKIENEAIDGEGINFIRLRFELDKSHFMLDLNESEVDDVYMDMELLESKLETALQLAHSRFRLRNRGILARIFGGMIEKIRKSSTTYIDHKLSAQPAAQT